MADRRALYIATLVAIAAFLLLVAGGPHPGGISSNWSKAQHSPANPHLAPMHLCDSPARVTETYAVYLHRGTSLEDHFRKVNIDESKIALRRPETDLHAPRYFTDDIEEAVVTRIRADTAVDFVECEMGLESYEAWPILTIDDGIESENVDFSKPYRAPLRLCDPPSQPMDIYAVHLHPDASFDDHIRKADLDPPKFALHKPGDNVHTTPYYWFTNDIGDAALDRIRADTAVDFIECDLEPTPMEAWPIYSMGDMDESRVEEDSTLEWHGLPRRLASCDLVGGDRQSS